MPRSRASKTPSPMYLTSRALGNCRRNLTYIMFQQKVFRLFAGRILPLGRAATAPTGAFRSATAEGGS